MAQPQEKLWWHEPPFDDCSASDLVAESARRERERCVGVVNTYEKEEEMRCARFAIQFRGDEDALEEMVAERSGMRATCDVLRSRLSPEQEEGKK